jgi:hypothetical protein
MVPEALAQGQTHPQTQNQQQQDKHPKAKGAAAGAAIGAATTGNTSPERHLPTTTEGVRHLGAAVVRWSIGECNQKPILKSHIEPAL